jgi:hypothetical protein
MAKSLVNSALEKVDGKEQVVYHNEKDCSHERLGKVFKTLNGDHLTSHSAAGDSIDSKPLGEI